MPSQETSPWGTKMYSKMKLNIQPLNNEILSIALWSPQHYNSPQLPVWVANENQLKYEIKVFKPELFIEVRRKLDNRVIFSTSRGALIVSENYFEWSFHLGAGVQLVAAFDSLRVTYGRKILINNGHSSVIPYVIGFGKYIFALRMQKTKLKNIFLASQIRSINPTMPYILSRLIVLQKCKY